MQVKVDEVFNEKRANVRVLELNQVFPLVRNEGTEENLDLLKVGDLVVVNSHQNGVIGGYFTLVQ